MKRTLFALTIACVALVSCSQRIGVRETGFEPVYRELRSNVLDTGVPSLASRQWLSYFGLEERYDDDPATAIAELEKISRKEQLRSLQGVIAELHYDLALTEDDPGRFLSSALHAFLYLFGEGFDQEPNPYSSGFRLACDLYNRGLARALLQPSGEVFLASRLIKTPSGTVAIRSTRPGFPWGERIFSTFLPADAFWVRGLRERVRGAGLGVPLIAVQSGDTGLKAERVGRGIKLPATAFLRFDADLNNLAGDRLTASLELYLGSDIPTVEVAEQRVPLETDVTAALAHTLEESRLSDLEIKSFFGGWSEDLPAGVYMLQPYQEGKIPLVLIHGTASSPPTWAQTINGILADWRVGSRYQVWLALYNTGHPVAYSASLVRESLVQLHDELATKRTDSALSNMVLVGHSQGGLVTRLLVSESGDRIWGSVMDVPFESYPMEPEARELLEKTVFFEPLPFVRRAVFISTPHRGSYIAGGWLGKLGSKLIDVPGDLTKLATSAFQRSKLPKELRKIPTSVDNMDPNNRFVKTLAQLPFSQDVRLHSIVAVKPGHDPIEEGNDGVVEYSSAHLENVDSELVIRYGHSCQGRPEAIAELRRILFEHLQKSRRAADLSQK